jgi:hypothetical protein
MGLRFWKMDAGHVFTVRDGVHWCSGTCSNTFDGCLVNKSERAFSTNVMPLRNDDFEIQGE